MSKSPFLLSAVAILTSCSWVLAEVGDPTLRTDHPHYPGEGAFQTIEDCVEFATARSDSTQDRAIALYNWLLTHQWHLASPQEPYLVGLKPDTRTDNYDLMVTDANRARFSYGYGLCGTVHTWNEPYWNALGMKARRRAFPGHTNSEIFYDGSWHAFDTDMAGLIFRTDGTVAGYEDVRNDPSIINRARPPIPCYPFNWPNDFKTMQKGWEEVAKGSNWYKMYHSGFAAHPGIVHLRAGETFTRYFDRDHFGGPAKRRYWHNHPGGPDRNWTFANQGTPRHVGPESNCLSQATYCNGEFIYRPNLSQPSCREGMIQASGNVATRGSSPHLHSKDEKEASCTFIHFSPYVICGDPADDVNPMTQHATGGLILKGKSVGAVRCELSVDQGQSWQPVSAITEGAFEVDLTDDVKGRYGWHIRFSWAGPNGLDELSFETVTQVCQTIYPRLKPGGSNVKYRAASRAVTPMLPNLSLPETSLATSEVRSLRSDNLRFTPRTPKSRYGYATTNNKPASVVFRVASPQQLLEVAAAARFGVRSPSPEGCAFRLEISEDDGNSWHPLAAPEIPSDNEYSSGWMSGRHSLASNAKAALVRVTLHAGGHSTGLIDFQAYGTYRTQRPQPASITYAWREASDVKQHREELAANTDEHAFQIPTGQQIVDEFVRIEVP